MYNHYMTTKTASDNRNISIDLLKVFAIFGVLVHHYCNTTFGAALAFVPPRSASELILYFLDMLAHSSVDVFVLITGYFMAGRTEVSKAKPVKLLIQTAVYSAIGITIIALTGVQQELTPAKAIGYYLCIYWFVFIFIALYLASPYINKALDGLEMSKLRMVVLGLVILFSCFPFATNLLSFHAGIDMRWASTITYMGDADGYSIVQFVVMYVIGYMLKKTDIGKIGFGRSFCMFAGVVIIHYALAIFYRTSYGYVPVLFNYNSPFIIAEATLAFVVFSNLRIRRGSLISRISASSFSVYIYHIYVIKHLGIESAVTGSPLLMVLHLLISCLAMFIAGWLLSEIYNLISGLVLKLIRSH
ncbi:MAG: acyltransferase family protein [Saccharofermentans sp.]|nr:acyltransferase family protein [Saccharofermentans sp.]